MVGFNRKKAINTQGRRFWGSAMEGGRGITMLVTSYFPCHKEGGSSTWMQFIHYKLISYHFFPGKDKSMFKKEWRVKSITQARVCVCDIRSRWNNTVTYRSKNQKRERRKRTSLVQNSWICWLNSKSNHLTIYLILYVNTDHFCWVLNFIPPSPSLGLRTTVS